MSADPELDALRRPFRIGVLAVLAVIVAIGGVVAAFGTPADRPAGIAERWLVALSDTTRDGVRDDARDRMIELMSPDAYVASGTDPDPLAVFPSFRGDTRAADDGKARFSTIRVGRAFDDMVDEGLTMVPVEVTAYDTDDVVDGYVLMQDTDDGWKVLVFVPPDAMEDLGAFEELCPGDRCPGFPIERPERAPIGFWIGAAALGVLITFGCSAAVRAAGRSRGRATGVAS